MSILQMIKGYLYKKIDCFSNKNMEKIRLRNLEIISSF